MQSMLTFCDECGLANEDRASICSVCRKSLIRQPGTSPVSATPAGPAKVSPSGPLRVVAGNLAATRPLKNSIKI